MELLVVHPLLILKSEESEESEELLGGIQEKNSNENSRVEIFSDTPSETLQTLQTFQTTGNSRMGRSEEFEGLNNSSDLTLQTSQKCLKFEEFFMRYSPKEFDTLRKGVKENENATNPKSRISLGFNTKKRCVRFCR